MRPIPLAEADRLFGELFEESLQANRIWLEEIRASPADEHPKPGACEFILYYHIRREDHFELTGETEFERTGVLSTRFYWGDDLPPSMVEWLKKRGIKSL
jgi:hypothetical protein